VTAFDPAAGPIPELIANQIHCDERGAFQELYSRQRQDWPVAQVNHSYSHRGTIRGMHWQIPPQAICKYVTVLSGLIEDVVIDLRRSSQTFGQWHRYLLSDGHYGHLTGSVRHSLYVPAGFAHGFGVLSEHAHVVYLQDKPYCRDAERSCHHADLGISWAARFLKDASRELLVSAKDQVAPLFKDLHDDDLFA
jgi:dTDP-4-dehydrorhamnose 3,5-epimerase